MRNKRFLSKVLASSMSLFMIAGMCPASVFAADTDTEETTIVTETEDVQEADTEASVEEAPAEETEVVSDAAEADIDTEEITADLETEDADETATEETDTEEAPSEELSSVSIGDVTYYYANVAGDAENTVYKTTVRGRGGSTEYSYNKNELTAVADTDYSYVIISGTALSGTLYGYIAGSGTTKTYKEVYADIDATISTDDAAYDAVSSATAYTSFHAKDISSVVSYGTDADGVKVINGVTSAKETTSVDANDYVVANILKAAGETLTDEQEAIASVTLKQNPTEAPSTEKVTPVVASATLSTSSYGTSEFVIVPDDTVTGYKWNEYWDNMYAATVSDGATTVGAVHWVDMYGEKCTSGYHYNKVELALNNGTSVGANAATVNRYAAFYDTNTNNIKAGTYTITLYSEGYEPLTATVEVTAETLNSVTVGGVNYYYTNAYDSSKLYKASVRSRAGSTDYYFSAKDLTKIADTDYYYTVLPGTTALSGSLYAYTGGSTSSYKDIYKSINASIKTDDAAYDAVSSATTYTSGHAKDISSVVAYGTDAAGSKAITGVSLGRTLTTVDADTYVAASILKAAGVDLTEEQTAALAVTLKQNPTEASASATVTPVVKEASVTTSSYGINEFVIVPDDSVEGYKWNEYWDNMYAATVSDGTTTVGAVHWVDLYGEKCTSGFHYNKVELALNNGTSVGANAATVNRYAAFFDANNKLKCGTYTITLYSEGYAPLTATVKVEGAAQTITTSQASYDVTVGGAFNLTAKTSGNGTLTYSSSNANVASVDAAGNVTAKAAGTAVITVNASATGDYAAATASVTVTVKEAATPAPQPAVISKVAQSISGKNISKKIAYSKAKKKAQSFSIGAKAKTSVSYKVTKYGKNAKKYISVSKKGKVTVKKKAKKGTYTVYVKATAATNTYYKSATKTIKVVVKVK